MNQSEVHAVQGDPSQEPGGAAPQANQEDAKAQWMGELKDSVINETISELFDGLDVEGVRGRLKSAAAFDAIDKIVGGRWKELGIEKPGDDEPVDGVVSLVFDLVAEQHGQIEDLNKVIAERDAEIKGLNVVKGKAKDVPLIVHLVSWFAKAKEAKIDGVPDMARFSDGVGNVAGYEVGEERSEENELVRRIIRVWHGPDPHFTNVADSTREYAKEQVSSLNHRIFQALQSTPEVKAAVQEWLDAQGKAENGYTVDVAAAAQRVVAAAAEIDLSRYPDVNEAVKGLKAQIASHEENIETQSRRIDELSAKTQRFTIPL